MDNNNIQKAVANLRRLARQGEGAGVIALSRCDQIVIDQLANLTIAAATPKPKKTKLEPTPSKRKEQKEKDNKIFGIWHTKARESVRDLSPYTNGQTIALSLPANISLATTLSEDKVIKVGQTVFGTCQNANSNAIRQHYLFGLFMEQLAQWYKCNKDKCMCFYLAFFFCL